MDIYARPYRTFVFTDSRPPITSRGVAILKRKKAGMGSKNINPGRHFECRSPEVGEPTPALFDDSLVGDRAWGF